MVVTRCWRRTFSWSSAATSCGKKSRLGELARADGDAAVAALRSGPPELAETTFLVERGWHLAYEIDHALDDCLYLAAAEVCDAMVVTADQRFCWRCSPSTCGRESPGLAIGDPVSRSRGIGRATSKLTVAARRDRR